MPLDNPVNEILWKPHPRQEFPSGMMRDTAEGKVRYDLVFDGPLVERLAKHLTDGAVRYGDRNWMKANGQEEIERFTQSAVRHFIKWLKGDKREDNFAATVFNMNGVELVKAKMEERNAQPGTCGEGGTTGCTP